jgi:hypothetical protein
MAAWSRGALFAAAVLAVAGAVVVTALSIVGSPAEARRFRLDTRRVEDLRDIAQVVDAYWTRTRHLPASPDELTTDFGLPAVPRDPETGVSYGYAIKDGKTYELCASFDRASNARSRPIEPFWAHATGRQCFTLEPKDTGR